MRIIVAGGGTAGHIEPALNFADEAVRRHGAHVVALGTRRGLEVDLVPARGYSLELIDPVPLPRRVNRDLFTLPFRLRHAVAQARSVIDRESADVIVGFGGFVALPAYLAARGRVPIVIHEANARAGIANRIGARFAAAVAESVVGSLPEAVLTGNPLRPAIAHLDRLAARGQARAHFGIPDDAAVLLVFGGSQGARRINGALAEVLPQLGDICVLHSHGALNQPLAPQSSTYVPVPYIDRMDLAYAAADFAVCRSGAMTVAELTAVGLPACYVPLPIGNGEQALNVEPVVTSGGGIVISDRDFTGATIATQVVPLLADANRLAEMSRAARELGRPDAAARLLDVVESVL